MVVDLDSLEEDVYGFCFMVFGFALWGAVYGASRVRIHLLAWD
jgi:hypothetical protein